MRRRVMRELRPKTEQHIPEVPWTPCNRMRWDAILDRIPEEQVTRAAEIGVLYGATSARILRKRPLLTLFMVEPWEAPSTDSDYYQSGDTNATKTQADHDKAYGIARAAVDFAGNRAFVVRKHSVQAAEGVPDGSLDMVFIDGDHSARGVSQDIEAWLPKVRRGGWIGGHDYDHPLLPWVKEVVDQQFRADKIELDANRTWFVRVE